MFLSRRTTQAEYFDSERPLPELAEFFDALGKINRFFVFAEPFQRYLPRLLEEPQPQKVSILDIGAGDGLLGRTLSEWSARRGWNWQVTHLDVCLAALNLNSSSPRVAASALALPFRDNSFDIVIASQMTHHLTDLQVRQSLRESWRVARQGVVICDLHRNVGLYGLLWLFFQVRRYPRSFREDALLSVKRSWRLQELRRLANEAGMDNAEAKLYFGTRVVLQARKAKTAARIGG
ncbi:MAG TPA: methyltransferase domain-containing protein [Clostridia bacterium]|nr:methyltransferase domain-containing protein [Clostridia bacterium]